jgi:hypothetical protein
MVMGRRRGWSLAAIASTASAVVLAASPSSSAPPRVVTTAGCPVGVNGRTVRTPLVDGVIAAARRVVVDGKFDTPMGRKTARTPTNYRVIQVVQLTPGPPGLPSTESLRTIAARRCGQAAAEWAWAVTFHPSTSVLCCLRHTVFVVRTHRGWYVF